MGGGERGRLLARNGGLAWRGLLGKHPKKPAFPGAPCLPPSARRHDEEGGGERRTGSRAGRRVDREPQEVSCCSIPVHNFPVSLTLPCVTFRGPFCRQGGKLDVEGAHTSIDAVPVCCMWYSQARSPSTCSASPCSTLRVVQARDRWAGLGWGGVGRGSCCLLPCRGAGCSQRQQAGRQAGRERMNEALHLLVRHSACCSGARSPSPGSSIGGFLPAALLLLLLLLLVPLLRPQRHARGGDDGQVVGELSLARGMAVPEAFAAACWASIEQEHGIIGLLAGRLPGHRRASSPSSRPPRGSSSWVQQMKKENVVG